MNREDILEKSKTLKETGEFVQGDFWKRYTEQLDEKLKARTSDCINLSEEKLFRAQGAAQTLKWALFDLPEDILREMGTSSDESEPPTK